MHLPRYIVSGDFVVSCDTIDKIWEFLKDNFHLQSGKVREYDHEGYINEFKVHKMKSKKCLMNIMNIST